MRKEVGRVEVEALPDFDALWDYDRPAETEAAFRALLPLAGGAGAYASQLLTQIARAEGLQRRFAEAGATLDEAQRCLEGEAVTGDVVRAQIRLLLERGRVCNSAGAAEQARPFFWEAWELALGAGEDFYAIDAAHMLAIVLPLAEQFGWNEKALALAETSADPRAQRWCGSLWHNLGWSYHATGQYAEALEVFQKALRWREAEGDTAKIRIARWTVARALRSLNRVAEALEIQTALLEELERTGATDGYVNEEMAECLLLLAHGDAARPHFARAYAELSRDPWLQAHEAGRIERLKALGLGLMAREEC